MPIASPSPVLRPFFAPAAILAVTLACVPARPPLPASLAGLPWLGPYVAFVAAGTNSTNGCADRQLTSAFIGRTLVKPESAHRGCGVNLGLVYAVSPRETLNKSSVALSK